MEWHCFSTKIVKKYIIILLFSSNKIFFPECSYLGKISFRFWNRNLLIILFCLFWKFRKPKGVIINKKPKTSKEYFSGSDQIFLLAKKNFKSLSSTKNKHFEIYKYEVKFAFVCIKVFDFTIVSIFQLIYLEITRDLKFFLRI